MRAPSGSRSLPGPRAVARVAWEDTRASPKRGQNDDKKWQMSGEWDGGFVGNAASALRNLAVSQTAQHLHNSVFGCCGGLARRVHSRWCDMKPRDPSPTVQINHQLDEKLRQARAYAR